MNNEHAHKLELFTVSGIHLAEITILMMAKDDASPPVERVLELKGVASVEQLDGLTVHNLLHYLRSL